MALIPFTNPPKIQEFLMFRNSVVQIGQHADAMSDGFRGFLLGRVGLDLQAVKFCRYAGFL